MTLTVWYGVRSLSSSGPTVATVTLTMRQILRTTLTFLAFFTRNIVSRCPAERRKFAHFENFGKTKVDSWVCLEWPVVSCVCVWQPARRWWWCCGGAVGGRALPGPRYQWNLQTRRLVQIHHLFLPIHFSSDISAPPHAKWFVLMGSPGRVSTPDMLPLWKLNNFQWLLCNASFRFLHFFHFFAILKTLRIALKQRYVIPSGV